MIFFYLGPTAEISGFLELLYIISDVRKKGLDSTGTF
jgi:hypothetical protein